VSVRARITTHREACRYLESLIRPETVPYRERAAQALVSMRALLAECGDPHEHVRAVHIAGSKGKGTVALLLERVLEHAGVSTGTYTSPHLVDWRERFRVGGRPVAGARLAAALDRLRPAVERVARESPLPPSFFDVATATALLLFREARIDVAVVETGIGGRLDATNVVRPALACITSVEHEHTDKLGETLAEIAREKAGIVKPGAPLVVGPLPPEAESEVRARADEVGVPVAVVGTDVPFAVTPRRASQRLEMRLAGRPVAARIPFPGRHLAVDAAIALVCAAHLPEIDADRLITAAPAALARARLPARVELLARRPWLVVDGAHTRTSADALHAALAPLPAARRHVVLSLSRDKPQALAALLARGAATVHVTRADPDRSEPPERIARSLRALDPAPRVLVEPDPRLALRRAFAALAADDLLLATGSVYLAGLARRVLRRLLRAQRDGVAPSTFPVGR